MGNGRSKVIAVKNVEDYLSRCKELGQKNCSVYGNLHFVLYDNDLEIYLGQSLTNTTPTDHSLHYLAPPNLLIIPQFTLLENAKPQSLESLLDLITGVAELCSSGEVGIGHNRIGFAGRWGIVGEKTPGWGYQQVFNDPNTTGVYLSPQLVLGLSQEKLYPKHDPIKSDMFALGIMLLEIIFQQKLTQIFDYHQFEIKLKPLLEKLNVVRQEFGEHFYNIILRMLELDEAERINFGQLIELIRSLRKPVSVSSHMTSSTTPQNDHSTKSPIHRKSSAVFRNDASPFKGGNVFSQGRITQRLNNKTPTKQAMQVQREPTSKSPLKRDLRINTQFDKENTYNNPGHLTNRSPNKPNQLRKQLTGQLSRR